MELFQVSTIEHKQHVRTLFLQYISWAINRFNKECEIGFDPNEAETFVDNDMKSLNKFLPPTGHLILADVDGEVVGIVGMRRLDNHIQEIKRMYVYPQYRGQGIGRALVQHLINQSKSEQTSILRLDSARFMTSAHRLYRSFGFQEIEPYDGSEVEKEIQHHWIFMELKLK